MTASMKMTVFWDVTPCSLVEVYNVLEVLATSITRAMSKLLARNWFEIWEPVGQGRTLTGEEEGDDWVRAREPMGEG
jgi:hypothetical protein